MESKFKDYIDSEVNPRKVPLIIKILYIFYFGYGGSRAILLYRLAKLFQSKNIIFLSQYFYHKLSIDYGIYIHKNASIDIGFKMPHPTSIIIGAGVIIKKNVTIYQNVTIGGSRKGDWQKNNYPNIGNNVIIFSGAALLGNINIADNCIIGANSVVNKSFAENTTIAGIPAKLIFKGNSIEEIIN